MINNQDDLSLVAQVIAENDLGAYGLLVQRHQSRVRQFLRRLASNSAEADDLAQDTFLKAWNKISKFQGKGSFIGWLLRIAYREFLQSRRKSQRFAEVLNEYEQGNNETMSASGESERDADTMFQSLSEKERVVFWLFYVAGCTHAEISDTMELPLGSVKSVLQRGITKLRKRFVADG